MKQRSGKAQVPPGESRRVLVVDDDPVFSRMLQKILEAHGYQVAAAESGEGAFELLGRFPAEVALCDIWLGPTWAVELVPRLLAVRKGLICVMMTAYADIDTAIEALRLGAYDYLRKPFHPEDLLATLERCFERIRLERERACAEEQTRRLLEENRSLAQRSIQIQEEERRGLARELHDEIGQSLTAIQAYSEAIRQIAGAGCAQKIEEGVVAIQSAAGTIYDAVHAIIRRLRSGVLEQLGLVTALQELVSAWAPQHPEVRCVLRLAPGLGSYSEAVSLTVYRVVQEALTNVGRHSGASAVEIHLTEKRSVAAADDSSARGSEPGALWLRVIDDGVGMDTGTRQKGLGLVGMRERVVALNGHFSLKSTPLRGTEIEALIPLV